MGTDPDGQPFQLWESALPTVDQQGIDQQGIDQHGIDQHGIDQHGIDQQGGNPEQKIRVDT